MQNYKNISLKPEKTFLGTTFRNFAEFFSSTDFSKAILLGIALTLPILVGIKLEMLQIGITITVGALLASPSDVSGSIRHKTTGILLATALAMVISLIGGYLHVSLWLLFPILGVLMFSISYISIYGFRASLISFSGLFALVLSFSNVSSGGMPPYERALLIGIGGLWYVSLSLLWHVIFPKGPTEFYLSKTIKLTSEYLQIRGTLVAEKENRSELLKRLLGVQAKLTDTHETLRGILITRRTGSGKSTYEGKRLLIFAQMVDMLELAMANPVNYSKTDTLFEKKPQHLTDFQNLLFSMADRLEEISVYISNPKKIEESSLIAECLDKIEKDISEYAEETQDLVNENMLMLRNLYKYQSEQAKKIEKIEWLLDGPDKRHIPFIQEEEANRFLTKEDYNLEVLVENFNLRSSIFKHSLRIAAMTMIGYAVGLFFELQNSHWILLTLIVIMRPNFGLTKTRSRERTIGTLIGGALAIGIVLLTQNTTVYGILAIVTLVISFSMIQRNYKAAATFVTLSVVFIYALLSPDIFNVIQYRVTDTLIGAGLATLGNLFLWPAWEIESMQKTLLDTFKAHRTYFNEIVEFYKNKGTITPEYKVARKIAFLEMSDLNTAFQRMTQEPKSRQKNLDKIYELVVLNHTFLSSLASLSTYIINNPTTPASKNFEVVTAQITQNLVAAEAILTNNNSKDLSIDSKSADIFEATYGQTMVFSNEENLNPCTKLQESDFHSKIEEVHLVREQLKWLLSMSEKMPKLLKQTPF